MEDDLNFNSPLRVIEGLTVTHAEEIHDYVQLQFGDQIGVSIYNKFEIYPESSIYPQSSSFDMLLGKVVGTVADRRACVEIVFVDGTRLKIDLRDQAYRGPEALELYREGYPPVIWN